MPSQFPDTRHIDEDRARRCLYGVAELAGRVVTVDPKRLGEIYRISRELKKGGLTLHLIDEERYVAIAFTRG